MGTSAKPAREKISTTVSSDTHDFLRQMVKRGEVASLAEALDAVVTRLRRLENRRRLALATTRYFEESDSKTATSEEALARDLTLAASAIDFDKEI